MGNTYSSASEAKADRKQQNAHRINVEPTTTARGDRGQYYRVHYRGAPLVDQTWNQELEACRAQLARGISGRLEVRRPSKAEWTVKENESHGPRFVRWQPRREDLSQNAVCRVPEILPAAVFRVGPSLQANAAEHPLGAQNVKVSKSCSDRCSD